MAAYAIERLRPELVRGTAALRSSVFGGSRTAAAAYLEWMYGENPYLEDAPLYVALHDGVPVGIRGVLGTSWESRRLDRPLTLPCLTDAGIEAEHRNRGLYEELQQRMLDELAQQGYPFALNLTPSPENVLASTLSGAGFTIVGDHGVLERAPGLPAPLRPGRPAARLRDEAARAARRLLVAGRRRPFATLDGLSPGERAADKTAVSISREARPDDMAGLVARVPADDRLRHVRDSAYFRWRYRNPLAEHRFVYAERGHELVGYAVLQRPRSGGIVDVADLEAVDGPARRRLLETILRGRFPVLRTWSATLAADVVCDLEAHGFRKPARRHRFADRFILCPLGEAGESRWTIAGLDVRRVDSWELRLAVAMTY